VPVSRAICTYLCQESVIRESRPRRSRATGKRDPSIASRPVKFGEVACRPVEASFVQATQTGTAFTAVRGRVVARVFWTSLRRAGDIACNSAALATPQCHM
jgi:hypothetical protein